MKIIKYGGNALKSKMNRLAIYKKIKNINDKIVMIVSAFKDSPYSTNELSMLVNQNCTYEMKQQMIVLGEIISSLRVCNELLNEGINAMVLFPQEIGISVVTSDQFDYVDELDNRFLQEKLLDYDVIVIPGFIAINQEGYFVSLNKGGSDLSAVLIAKMLDEKEIFLYKDVLGLSSIDPQLSTQFKLFKQASFEQMMLLCEHKNPLIQKEALHYAQDYDIRIHVSHFLNDTHETLISKKGNDKMIVMSYEKNCIYIDGYQQNEKISNLLLNNHLYFDYIMNHNRSLKIVTSEQNEKEILLFLHERYVKGEL